VNVGALGHLKIFDLRLPIYDLKTRIAKRRKIEHESAGQQKKIAEEFPAGLLASHEPTTSRTFTAAVCVCP
jgi:hypothetical protein